MLRDSKAFSGFSVDSLTKAKQFYGELLGLEVQEDGMGLQLNLGSGTTVFIYEKEGHTPATFTILNFPVADINVAVDELVAKGVVFERYDNLPDEQDQRGVLRGLAAGMGPDIAWFKDPAGNVLSMLQQS